LQLSYISLASINLSSISAFLWCPIIAIVFAEDSSCMLYDFYMILFSKVVKSFISFWLKLKLLFSIAYTSLDLMNV
jgi:hypothetical protein